MRIRKIIFGAVALLITLYMGLWLASRTVYPIAYGVSFDIPRAEWLGLDWKKAYIAILDELKPKFIRLSATWSATAKKPDRFDTSALDWQFKEAGKRGAKIALVVGQKAPRWPECYIPDWTAGLSNDEFKTTLFAYIRHVVEKYRNNPALELWQMENEPYIHFQYGECARFHAELVKEEIALVRSIDPAHNIMITDSGELGTWSKASTAGDLFGTTLYRIVRMPHGRIITYDWLPPAVYRFKAHLAGLDPHEVIISELQAEPWFTVNDPTNTPIAEQEKTLDPSRLAKHFNYASRTGFSRAYLWGTEWWYWMKVKQNDARYWDLVKHYVSSP